MANLESSQDGELDAILGELCALESTINTEMPRGHARSVSGVTDGLRLSKSATGVTLEGPGAVQQLSCHYSSAGTKFETQADMLERDEGGRVQKQEFGLRTDSPDNDSAFSDNVSMLSSESSASSGGGAIRSDASSQNMYGQSGHGPQITVSSQVLYICSEYNVKDYMVSNCLMINLR
ncbi:uncharacterized protein LOC106476901, partial [Limulus polyphemus]|uniref:Uncharacterized protein LOC106476901 n=1 Tax=Limulus polyphemus TaxID=6850 RepID=A0ABM1C2B8_LIMPO